ncbi:hypothetical protein LENED_004334 [Lentinula edodes]|uniref:Uncharacterized protein n=1 Tax=Lentinula edodes TaxID=5353 RepID=A0A1Q3E5X3_LENED|nr:hypothetical protein LENED_004334 [Lentinula edodes]
MPNFSVFDIKINYNGHARIQISDERNCLEFYHYGKVHRCLTDAQVQCLRQARTTKAHVSLQYNYDYETTKTVTDFPWNARKP